MASNPAHDATATCPGPGASGLGGTPIPRDRPLDYLRSAGLCLMSLAHMWRAILGQHGLDSLILSIAEGAPCVFFFAFGMTQTRLVSKPPAVIARHLILFGLIAAFHSYFLFYTVMWDFFQCLWFAAVLIVLGAKSGMQRRDFLAASVAVLVLNTLLPLGPASILPESLSTAPKQQLSAALARHLWGVPGSFFPLPWSVVVVLGFALGMNNLPAARRLAWPAGLACAAMLVLGGLAADMPDAFRFRLQLNKWTATSPYLVCGSAATLLLYVAWDRFDVRSLGRRWLYPPVRRLSDHLLVGTVLHYLVVRVLTAERFGWLQIHGVRRVDWVTVVILSAANLTVLTLLVALMTAAWQKAIDHGGTVLRHLRLRVVVGAAVMLMGGLYWSRSHLRLGYSKWTAFLAMLGLALYYEYDRTRRARLGRSET